MKVISISELEITIVESQDIVVVVTSTFIDYYLLTGAYTESLNKTTAFAKIY